MILSALPQAVFPAYAGMSPQVCSLEIWDVGFPRLRGDEPRAT